MINLHNKDCYEALKDFKDNQFDLAIIDPPYGIGESGGKFRMKPDRPSYKLKKIKHKKKEWDNKPCSMFFFSELKRVSKNQIIFGANHFIENIPNANSSCWVVWDKNIGGDFADCELAYCSFKTSIRKFFGHPFIGTNGGKNRIHPTQKPVKLYEFLLMTYAKEGDKILDTHLGSGSIAIACHNLGFDLEGYEIDSEYFEAASKRLKEHQQQIRMF